MKTLLKKYSDMERCSREEDLEFAGIVLWLRATEQEAHVDAGGNVYLNPGRHTDKRRKRRSGQAAMSAAELKRARKAEKRKEAMNGTR